MDYKTIREDSERRQREFAANQASREMRRAEMVMFAGVSINRKIDFPGLYWREVQAKRDEFERTKKSYEFLRDRI